MLKLLSNDISDRCEKSY